MQNITIEELFKTDSYKRNGIIYPHPMDLINRAFIDPLLSSTLEVSEISVNVDKEGGAGTEEHNDVVTWGRGLVLAETKHNNEKYDLRQVFGIIWAYDTTKPIIKIFHGATVKACMNLMVAADEIKELNLGISLKLTMTNKEKEKVIRRKFEDVEEIVADTVKEYIDNSDKYFNKVLDVVVALDTTILPVETEVFAKERNYTLHPVESKVSIEKAIGIMYLHDVIRGTFDYSTFNFAFQLMYDSRILHINKGMYSQDFTNSEVSLWTIHNAMTQRISDGRVDVDLFANKSLEVTKLLMNLKQYIQ
jgi:hypothetical protein